MHRTTTVSKLLLLSAVVVGIVGGAAEQRPDCVQRVESGLPEAIVIQGHTPKRFSIQERMRFYKTPGVSVVVIEDGAIAWVRGYGVCESGDTNRVTPKTLFQAGSISKPVAALLALSFVQDGRLGLDDDVNELVFAVLPAHQTQGDVFRELRRR